jgi:hypothetical protein
MRYFIFVLIFILGCKEKPKSNSVTQKENADKTPLVYKALNESVWEYSTKSDKEKYRFWISYGMGVETHYMIRIEAMNNDTLKVVFKKFTCVECNPLISKVTEKNFKIIESKETFINRKGDFKWAVSYFEFWQLENDAVDRIRICDGTSIGIEGLRPMIDSNDIRDKARFKMYNSLGRGCAGSQNPVYELTLYAVNLIGGKDIIDFDTPSVFFERQEESNMKQRQYDQNK